VHIVFRGETGITVGLQSVVLGRLAGAKASLGVVIACLAEGLVKLDYDTKVVEAYLRRIGIEQGPERAGQGRQMFMPPNCRE
jgi:hypothetical protein